MKKLCITFLLLSIIGLLIFISYDKQTVETQYLRLHIRADSNEDVDQNIKYAVKDVVVEFLTPYVAQCNTKDEAKEMLNTVKSSLKLTIDSFLLSNNFSYVSTVEILSEEFPTRVYENYTLEEGVYDALIINLGSGVGDNWWCVVYPPLCFTSTENGSIIYQSKIYDIIQKFNDKIKEEL